MQIRRLLIEHLRNIETLSIDELATLNFFIGHNGAGKTSILEALAIASQGRSFRTNKVNTVISQQQPQLSVFVECSDSAGVSHKLGIQRDRKNSYRVRIDGANAASLAELSAVLPVVVVDTNAFQLLDGSSSIRRRFIDWGVFHVEHGFYETWKSFNRILKQRNALLRSSGSDYSLIRPWDREFVQLAVKVESFRRSFLSKFQPALMASLQQLDEDLCSYSIFYKNGWGSEKLDIAGDISAEAELNAEDMLSLLEQGFQRDSRYQRTHIGPHRADIQIRFNKLDARDVFSRGQKKTMVSAMKLAQADVVTQHSGKQPVLLLDDLPSELDSDHLTRFINYVIDKGYQSFITAVDDRLYHHNSHVKARMFHVERGRICTQIAQGEAQE